MYAVMTTGGKQYRVAQGDRLRVQKIDVEKGGTVELPVSLIANDGDVVIDPAKLGGAKVVATVVEHGRLKKIKVFKYKRRQGYRRTQGHRQDYTTIKIEAIQG